MNRRYLILAGILATLVLAFLFLFGAGGNGANVYSAYDEEGVNRYFKTPQSAALRAGELIAEEDFARLGEYYDVGRQDLMRRDVESGIFFQVPGESTGHRPPFEAGYTFKEILGTEYPDIFEVVVAKPAPDGNGELMQFFYVKRYPQGYRFLIGKPRVEVSDGFE